MSVRKTYSWANQDSYSTSKCKGLLFKLGFHENVFVEKDYAVGGWDFTLVYAVMREIKFEMKVFVSHDQARGHNKQGAPSHSDLAYKRLKRKFTREYKRYESIKEDNQCVLHIKKNDLVGFLCRRDLTGN